MINISAVLYKPSIEEVSRLIRLIDDIDSVDKLYLIDNSEVVLSQFWNSEKVVLFHCPHNPGYGSGHNIALRKTIESNVSYHIVMNTDVVVSGFVIEELLAFMNKYQGVALVSPKILSPDGSDQGLCKYLPRPVDLLSRLLPFQLPFSRPLSIQSEGLRYASAPYLSGCFMFLRCSALVRVGMFDERYFMYPEDIDLSRRMFVDYDCVMDMKNTATHVHGRASKKSLKMFRVHLFNMIKYFNKWGWFVDRGRKKLNEKALKLNDARRAK